MKEFFKKLNWFERIFPIVAIIVLIVTFAIGETKNWLSFFTSVVGVFAFFCVAKGFFIAPFLSIIQAILYLTLSYYQMFYGEMVLGGVSIVSSVLTIVTWLKNRNKEDKNFVEVNKVKWLEYVLLIPAGAALGVGCYFMLKAFNTNELLVSTFSMVASLIAAYLVIRRSSYYALLYIINDIIVVVLWSLTVKNMGLEFLPTILGSVIYFVIDVYALVNWKLMEKKQNRQKVASEELEGNN